MVLPLNTDFPTFFTLQEHSGPDHREAGRLRARLVEPIVSYAFSAENTEYLGIDDRCSAGYYVGMRWIHVEGEDGPERAVLQIQPKHRNDLSLATNLLERCIGHPTVSTHMQHAYRLFPDEPLIPVPQRIGDQLLIFVITDYLTRVRNIVRKGIKRAFMRRRSTRNGSPKGKIHMGASIRAHYKSATVLPTVCSYDVHSVDTAENRILKAALYQTGKYVTAHLPRNGFLQQLLAENATGLEQVTLKSIEPNDRRQVRHSPFFAEYRPALEVAETILKWLGTSPGTDVSGARTRIPPFFIDMPELFERYCEVLLRERYSDIKAGYGRHDRSETAAGKRKLRPDFLLPSRNAILDSKYKYWIEQSSSNADYGQLALYARHIPLVKQLGNESEDPDLYLLYPSSTGHKHIDLSEHMASEVSEFRSLYEYPVFVPQSLT